MATVEQLAAAVAVAILAALEPSGSPSDERAREALRQLQQAA